MPVHRQLRVIAPGDTGSFTDTGPPVFGEFVQMRWEVTVGDTGADLQIFAQQKEADTGDGVQVFSRTDCLGVDIKQKAPRQPVSDLDGFDTGAATIHRSEPVYLAGERLRVRIIPASAALIRGNLYLWTRDGK